MLRNRLMAAAAATALFAAPAAFAQDMPAEPVQAAPPEAVQASTVIDVLRAQGQFSTLLGALEQAQLTDVLNRQPAVTLFAPTDAAFAALPSEERERLLAPENANELRQRLLYHVIVADVDSSQIQGTRGPVETAARSRVQLDGSGDAIKIDDATVVQADIDASNGAVFAIDRVLNPANSLAAMGDEDATAAAEPAAEPVTDDQAADIASPTTDEPRT